MLYEDMYKYKLASTVKARVVDTKKDDKKVIEGKVIIISCEQMKKCYTLLDDKGNVYKVVEDDFLECK